MEQTLVLNATYEPLRIVSWQKAITLLFQGKVEVIAVYDREIRGVTVRVKLPSVLRLLRHVRMKRPFADVPFSRANVYARDDHRCQYCGRKLPPPSSRSTTSSRWPVAATRDGTTSSRAASRAIARRAITHPRRSGSNLQRKPRRPESLPSLTLSLGLHRAPDSWRDYLFWDISLDRG